MHSHTKLRAPLALLAALAMSGCASDLERRATTADLAAAPEAYVGVGHSFEGAIQLGGFACTLVECGGSAPCNQCLAPYVVGEGPGAVVLVAADGYPLEVGEHLAIGCAGDEAEMGCVPGVPSRITAVHGTVEAAAGLHEAISTYEWMLVVDDIELADGPLEETMSGVHLSE